MNFFRKQNTLILSLPESDFAPDQQATLQQNIAEARAEAGDQVRLDLRRCGTLPLTGFGILVQYALENKKRGARVTMIAPEALGTAIRALDSDGLFDLETAAVEK